MFTVSRLGKSRWLLIACVLLGILGAGAEAHPVTQGGMVVTVSSQKLTVRVAVSLEEVLIASTYGTDGAGAKSPDEASQRYGPYLLEHLRVSADGQRLQGDFVQRESEDIPRRYVYELSYPLNRPVSEFRFEQDLLNEFEFAPGNRWESSYVVQINDGQGIIQEGLLLTSRQPLVFAAPNASGPVKFAPPPLDRWQVFRDYFHHGLLHILTGYDHLLFVAALVLSVCSLWELVKVVTAFTLAHSITLVFSALDVFRLPSPIVEPVIAGSIAFVALQNIVWPERAHGWSRLAVAFFFGLFHGLGFAGGLLEAMTGMSSNALILAIVGFSVGVEVAHQVVVVPTFCALRFARGWRRTGGKHDGLAVLVSRWGSAAICLAGMVYLGAALRWW